MPRRGNVLRRDTLKYQLERIRIWLLSKEISEKLHLFSLWTNNTHCMWHLLPVDARSTQAHNSCPHNNLGLSSNHRRDRWTNNMKIKAEMPWWWEACCYIICSCITKTIFLWRNSQLEFLAHLNAKPWYLILERLIRLVKILQKQLWEIARC